MLANNCKYYGLIGFDVYERANGQKFYESEHLMFNENIVVVVKEISKLLQQKVKWSRYVFYEIKDCKPILMTYDTLIKIPTSHCQYLQIFRYYRIVTAPFSWPIDPTFDDLCHFVALANNQQLNITSVLKKAMFNYFKIIRQQTVRYRY